MNEREDFGPCCYCESAQQVYAVVMLDFKQPKPHREGRGWGCVACGLPPEGAVSLLCLACAEAFEAGSKDFHPGFWKRPVICVGSDGLGRLEVVAQEMERHGHAAECPWQKGGGDASLA